MPQVSTVPPEALPQIPSALQVEHRVIHEALLRATKAPGDIGTAARELAGALHDHFVREEEIALPPLGLLAALALQLGTPAAAAAPLVDKSLTAELPTNPDILKQSFAENPKFWIDNGDKLAERWAKWSGTK